MFAHLLGRLVFLCSAFKPGCSREAAVAFLFHSSASADGLIFSHGLGCHCIFLDSGLFPEHRTVFLTREYLKFDDV